jgi:outer membrane cobalamin receptor
MTTIRLFSLLLILSGPKLFGQDKAIITGRVCDAESKEPLVAVNISADRRAGTVTDQDGRYSFILDAGDHIIEFYYLGFGKVQREVLIASGQTLQLDIQMSVISRLLDEVVVSAGKYEQKLSDVTVSMEVLKPHQLSSQNITSLDMILEKTSGISILDGQPSIRGGSGYSYGVGSRVLMLVDDLPMIAWDGGDIRWNYMPVENINQVEVIKGASSVLHGSSALNGVINLRTRFPGNEPSTDAILFGGIYADPDRRELVWWDRRPFFTGASCSHMRKIGNLDLSFGGNYYKNEGYREMEHEDRIRGNLAIRYRFKNVRGLTAGITMSAMYLQWADFILWQDADSGAYRQNPLTYAPLAGLNYNIDPYVEYFTSKGDRHSLKTRIYSVGNANMDIDKSSFAKLYYAEYRYLKKFGEQTNWTSGTSFSRNTMVANRSEEHWGTTTAVYSQLDANAMNRLKLSFGMRWEINTLDGDFYHSLPVLRAGINFRAGKATYLRTSFGQGYRFPSVAEKFAQADLAGLWIFKNPDLEPERGWSSEVGIKREFRMKSWIGYMDVALFWTEYKNMIEYRFGAFPEDTSAIPTFEDIGFKALNIGTARITGVEFSMNGEGQLGPVGINLTGGYTFMNPVDPQIISEEGKGEDEAYILKYRRRHLVKGDLELSVWKLLGGINIQYNSRMINVDEVFSNQWTGNLILPGFPDYWQNKAVSYLLMDFRLGWNISKSLRINSILRNAFNVEYLGRPGDIGPPRNLTLQLKLSF